MATKDDNQNKLDTGHCRKEYEHYSSILGEAGVRLVDAESLDSAWKDYKRAYNDYHQCLFQDYAVNGIILVGIVRGHSRYSTEYATAKVYLKHQESSAENVMFTFEVVDSSLREASCFQSLKVQQDLVDLVRMLRVAEDALDNVRLADLNLAESELSIEFTRKKEECSKLVDERWKWCSDVLPKYLSSRTFYNFFKDAV